mmetsp:Transcript_35913/g.53522  ORF Transcript_35913/g.53522 Transcript_35913/m.53522 type:complete len:92 (-) Transcript_35913:2371-2646(-)
MKQTKNTGRDDASMCFSAMALVFVPQPHTPRLNTLFIWVEMQLHRPNVPLPHTFYSSFFSFLSLISIEEDSNTEIPVRKKTFHFQISKTKI